MEVKLIRHTLDPDELAGLAAAKCTNAKNIDKAREHAMNAGHESVAEHAVMTFEIDGVSRVLLAQLTRHRVASFSVQSQRYCKLEVKSVESAFVVPPSMKEHSLQGYQSVEDNYLDFCLAAVNKYLAYTKVGVPEEDARFVLPQGIMTSLIMTMNIRELRHFFSLRMCNRAQWEIRDLADRMYTLAYKVAPALFDDAGPGCINHGCPEGKRCCGNPRGDEIAMLQQMD